MGEARRMGSNGGKMIPIQPGQQIQIDLKNATQKECECGCKFFIPVHAVYIISALVSPTGQELTAQQPVLICLECKKVLEGK